ncbi:MAG: hypothetical protein IPQ04_07820 [Saprospiraceae bacterium]|nr:hypothetical protein [Saprospiraceae bacterium]
MGLLDKIFGRKNEVKIDYTEMPFYWEDDYCQIEIVPKQNIENIKYSIKQIDNFTESTKTEYGFTDIFIRKGLPFPTKNEEYRIDAFEKLLVEKGFKKATQIRYESYTIINCSNKTSNALSLPCFNFFYDCDEEFLKNIWISTSLITSKEHFDIISETLYELGESYELILINWNSCELVDLSNRNQIKDYLMNYWK